MNLNSLLLNASLVSIALLSSVPFLITRHFQPLPSFASEWWAAVLGLVAMGFAFFHKSERLQVPRIALLPALFIVAISAQWMVGLIVLPTAAFIAVLYLVWTSLMMALGLRLSQQVGLQRLSTALAWGFLLGAVANACVGILQHLQVSAPPLWVYPGRTGVASGNLGQQNHFAAQLWLGLAAIAYLAHLGKLGRATAALLILLLTMAAGATQARGALVYSVLIAALLIVNGQRVKIAMMFPIAQITFFFAAPYAPILAARTTNSVASTAATGAGTLQRISNLGSDVRLELWHDAWQMFTAHPWLGIGTGSYERASVEHAASKLYGFPIPAEHAHNLVMQWLAEFGGITTVLALLLVIGFLAPALRRLRSDGHFDRFIPFAVIGILGLYSQIEYPLWYTYFLAPMALMLGALESQFKTIELDHPRLLLASILLVAACVLIPLRQDEIRLERATLWRHLGLPEAQAFAEALKSLDETAQKSLLAPYAEFVLTNSVIPSPSVAKAHWGLCQSVLGFAPTADVLNKCAASARLLGDNVTAEALERKGKTAWCYKYCKPEHR